MGRKYVRWVNDYEKITFLENGDQETPEHEGSFEDNLATDIAMRTGASRSTEVLKRAYQETAVAAQQELLAAKAKEVAFLSTQPGSRILLEYARGETSADVKAILEPTKTYPETSNPVDKTPPPPVSIEEDRPSWPGQRVQEERGDWQDAVIRLREQAEKSGDGVLWKLALLKRR